MRSEDGSIIYRCINGESEAFGLLVDKYKEGIYAFIYAKIRNFHDAEDITQEVFMEAFRNLRKLRRWDSFVFWLYSIAFNLCGKWNRSRSRRPDREFIDDQESETIMGITENTDDSDEVMDDESLHKALDLLPEIYRQVLTLYYLGGMSSIDIAKSLGVTPTSVRKRLSRAREQMKAEVLAMVNATFQQQELRAGFTFRVVEGIKRIKIRPIGQARSLPWGLSLAAGIIVAIFSLGSHVNPINFTEFPSGSPLLVESKALKVGEIPVDVVKIFKTPIIANRQDKGKGGEKLLDPQNDVFLAPQGEGNTWMKKADMPTARFILSTSVVDGKIYAIGGESQDFLAIKTVEEYDPVKDTWTEKADMPTARFWFSTSVVDGKIYAIGGGSGNGHLSTVEVYDPATDTWAKCLDMPTRRRGLSTSVVNGKIYAIGGDNKFGASLQTVEEYDPVKNIWTTKAKMPTGRAGLSTSVVDDKIYAICGIPMNIQGNTAISTVEEYDPATDTWTKKADTVTARNSPSACVVNGQIFVIGGTKTINGNGNSLSSVEAYNPATDKWTEKADMLTARGCLSASVTGGKIYALGGLTAADLVLSTVEEYTPEGWPFSILPPGKLPTKWGREKGR